MCFDYMHFKYKEDKNVGRSGRYEENHVNLCDQRSETDCYIRFGVFPSDMWDRSN